MWIGYGQIHTTNYSGLCNNGIGLSEQQIKAYAEGSSNNYWCNFWIYTFII